MFIFIGFTETIVGKLEEVLSDLKDVRRHNRKLLTLLNPATASAGLDHKYPSLPLKTTDELRETEEYIKDPEQFNKLVRQQSKIFLFI